MTVGGPDPRLGTDLGPYRIEAVIGRGGMGVVYRAEQARLGRKVALKIVSPEFASDPNARARFLRESQMAAAIDHPNILPIHEADEVHGVLFIAMRLVEGSDLAARLRDGALSPPAAIAILAQVASALDAAHARGLVHRDVKPANILLAPGLGADQGDHVYLTDFGLTKRGGADSSLTAVGGFAGTLDYIAPEQVDGRDLDGRADQYSLACMAFECLTGHLPYARDTDIAMAMAHLKDPPPSAASLKPELSPAVDEVLARGLSKAREDRYPTCMAFASDLRDALGVTASQARPTQSPAAPGKMLIGVGVAAMVMIIVAGLALGSGLLGASASPSSSRSQGAASVSSATPTISSAASTIASGTEGARPTDYAFPNPAERALLAQLPAGLQGVCGRGSYDAVPGDPPSALGPGGGVQGGGGLPPAALRRAPIASLACPQIVTSGANSISIRDFGDVASVAKGAWTTDAAVSGVASRQGVPGGNCASSKRANGRWQRAGVDTGAIVCFTDPSSGDAILYWSYEDQAILVEAVNAHGDPAALYAYFAEISKFIAK